MHAECFAKHLPCRNAWFKKGKPATEVPFQDEPVLLEPAAISTPPRPSTNDANAELARQLNGAG